MQNNMQPKRTSILGALVGLTLAENQGDVIRQVFNICDAVGIDRPVLNNELGMYEFPWAAED